MVCGDLIILLIILALLLLLFFFRSLPESNQVLPSNCNQSSLVETIRLDRPKRVRIMLPTGGSGLIQDARLYEALIPNSYIIQVDRNSPDSHIEAKIKVDVNLYLESVLASSYFPSNERWLMVNQEYFWPNHAEIVDVLITKSRYAYRLVSEYVKKVDFLADVVYLGHTSFPPRQHEDQDKNWNLCLHLAGRSRNKGTWQLIHTWQKEGGFRHIAPNATLVITCRHRCLNRITNETTNLIPNQQGWSDPNTGLYIYTYLDEDELDRYRRKAGLFICPSLVEGYGQYINEGSASRSIVMTTDFPPMNELVPVESRFLIPPELTLPSYQIMGPFGFLEPYLTGKHLPTSEACLPNFSEMARLLREYFSLSQEDKEKLAEDYFECYRQQQQNFRSALAEFLISRYNNE